MFAPRDKFGFGFGTLDQSEVQEDLNPNLGLAEDLIKYKKKLSDTLQNKDSITIDELRDCENLNPYKDWFIKVVKRANKMQGAVDT